MGQQGDWDDVGGGGPFETMALPAGESRIRCLIEKPWFLHEHWVDIPGEAGIQPRKIVCSGDENCLACKRGIAASKRLYIPVIDRADGKAKILEGGVMIFGEIKKYSKDPEYGDPTKYDIKIGREGTGMKTQYSTTPSPNKSDLTKEELALFAALPELSLYNPPMPVDEQRRIFLALDGGGMSSGRGEEPDEFMTGAEPEVAADPDTTKAATDFFNE